MIKDKLAVLVNTIKNSDDPGKDDDLNIVDDSMQAFGNYVNNVYICTSITNIVYMSDRQQFIIDCTSLIPVIGTLVLIKIANEQMVTMVAAYVLCGELLGVLISRILRLYYIDVAFVWLGGIMLWLWYWFGVQPSYMG